MSRCCGEDGDHDLKPGEFKTKCATCDDFYYCAKCVDQCPCGNDPVHYLCKGRHDQMHLCKWDADEKRCTTRVCEQYCGIKGPSGSIHLFCPNHAPAIPQTWRDALVRAMVEAERKKSRLTK